MDRPMLREMLDFVREGDTVVVESYSRISRSIMDLLKILEILKKKGVNFKSIKENYDTTDPSGNLTLNILASIGQYEREILLERQKEGILLAKKAGKYKGRAFVKIPSNFEACLAKYNCSTREKRYSIKEFMEETKLKKSTLLRIIGEYSSKSVKEERLKKGKRG